MCVSPGRQVLFPAAAGTPVLPADGGYRPRVPTEAEEGRPKSQIREHRCLPRTPPPPLPAKTRGLGLLRLLPGWGQRPQPPGERELPRNTGCKSSVRNKSVQLLHRLSPWLTFSHSSVTLHCPVRILELRRGRQNTAGPGRRHLPSALKPAESPSGQWPASRGDTCYFRQGPHATRLPHRRRHAGAAFRRQVWVLMTGSIRGCRPGCPRRGQPRANNSSHCGHLTSQNCPPSLKVTASAENGKPGSLGLLDVETRAWCPNPRPDRALPPGPQPRPPLWEGEGPSRPRERGSPSRGGGTKHRGGSTLAKIPACCPGRSGRSGKTITEMRVNRREHDSQHTTRLSLPNRSVSLLFPHIKAHTATSTGDVTSVRLSRRSSEGELKQHRPSKQRAEAAERQPHVPPGGDAG